MGPYEESTDWTDSDDYLQDKSISMLNSLFKSPQLIYGVFFLVHFSNSLVLEILITMYTFIFVLKIYHNISSLFAVLYFNPSMWALCWHYVVEVA